MRSGVKKESPGLAPFVPLLLPASPCLQFPPAAFATDHTFVPGAFALLTVQALYTVMRLYPPFALPLCHSERSEESPDDRLALLSLAIQVKRCQSPTRKILRSGFRPF